MIDALEKRLIEALKTVDAHGDVARLARVVGPHQVDILALDNRGLHPLGLTAKAKAAALRRRALSASLRATSPPNATAFFVVSLENVASTILGATG